MAFSFCLWFAGNIWNHRLFCMVVICFSRSTTKLRETFGTKHMIQPSWSWILLITSNAQTSNLRPIVRPPVPSVGRAAGQPKGWDDQHVACSRFGWGWTRHEPRLGFCRHGDMVSLGALGPLVEPPGGTGEVSKRAMFLHVLTAYDWSPAMSLLQKRTFSPTFGMSSSPSEGMFACLTRVNG